MSQRTPPNTTNSNPTTADKNAGAFNNEIIQQFLLNQKAQLVNEAEELKLRYKELDVNSKLAEKSMSYQAEHLSKQPVEGRKTITRFAYIFAGLTLILFIFIGYCLYLDQVDFIISFLKNAGYLLTTAMGYWFGRRVGKEAQKKNDKDAIQQAEVID